MELIVIEILEGKKGAASRFYREYSPKIRRFLLKKMPTERDAEDVLQEVFLSAFDCLPTYRGESRILTWLYAIARHEVADYYRKRYVRELVEKTSPLFEELLETAETPEKAWERSKMKARFINAYKSLTRSHQDILSYRYELSLSVKEIAEKMKLSFKATESLLYRARSAFAVAYEQQED